MATQTDLASALAALRAGAASPPPALADGRAALLSRADAPLSATAARVGGAYALLALPRGAAGAAAARALLEAALLPMADAFAVAPAQRAAARAALVGAALALAGLAKGQAVRVAPPEFALHARVEERAAALAAAGRAVVVDEFAEELAEDVAVLNEMQALVMRWQGEVDRIVAAARDGPGVVLPADEEQLFWCSVDAAFEAAETALAAPAAAVTMQLLARKRRLVAFQSDSGDALAAGRARARGILNLVRSLPVDPIRTADDIPALTTAVRSLLAHVTSKLRLSSFPLDRALTLVSSVSQDVATALCKLLLRRGGLLGQPYRLCCATAEECETLFDAWDSGFEACRLSAVERAEARGEKISARPKPAFTQLQTRLRDVTNFRSEHEALVAVVESCVAGVGRQFDVDEGLPQRLGGTYAAVADAVEGSAAADVSNEGEAVWTAAFGEYIAAVEPIEEELACVWDAAMGLPGGLEAKAAVSGMFTPVIDRPAFFSVVQRRMACLTELARSAIARIREKSSNIVASMGDMSQSSALQDFASARGLTPVAVRVLSLRHQSYAVTAVLAQVRQIVGQVRMGTDLDLQDLRSECDVLLASLGCDPIVDSWKAKLSPFVVEAAGGLFAVCDSKGLQLSLSSDLMAVPREVAALRDLGYASLGNGVAMLAERVTTLQPVYAMLSEALHAYQIGTKNMLYLHKSSPEAHARFRPLVLRQTVLVRDLFEKASTVLWTSDVLTLTALASRLRKECRAFCDGVMLATDRDRQIFDSFAALEQVLLEISVGGDVDEDGLAALRNKLRRIWKAVKDLKAEKTLRRVCSLYVKENVYPRMMRVLKCVLARSVENWLSRFQGGMLGVPVISLSFSSDGCDLCVSPPLADVEHQLFCDILKGISMISDLFAHENDQGAHALGISVKPFCLTKRGRGDDRVRTVIRRAGMCIYKCAVEAEGMITDWARYEELLRVKDLCAFSTGDEDVLSFTSLLDQVEETLQELSAKKEYLMKACKLAFPLNYSAALDDVLKVAERFSDSLSQRCATVLARETKAVYALASESVSLLHASAAGDAMESLLVLQEVGKSVLPSCDEKMEQLSRLQEVVSKVADYSPTEDSVDMDALQAATDSLRLEFNQRQRHVDADRPAFEARYNTEAGKHELALATLFEDVSRHKDTTAESEDAAGVLEELSKMDARLKELTRNSERLTYVSTALSLPSISSDMELETLVAELQDMRLSMTEVSGVQEEFASLGKTRFGDMDSKSLRSELERLVDRLRELQESRGNLSAASRLSSDVSRSLAVHGLVSSLRYAKLSSPRERELVEKVLGSDACERGLYNVSLHELWSCDLSKQEKYLRDVFDSAAGESALAAFITKVAEAWTSRRVEFVQRGRVYLIRGIPELVDDANEHLQALCAMAGSSQARLFESERASWELRIAKFRDEAEVWAEVQMKWLHLSSLFGEASPSSSTLRCQLRDEFSSFISVQARLAEFSTRAKGASGVLEVLEKPSGLDRMSTELSAVVRGLGKFLESQRSLFPRFFYLSDDDLLSMLSIGRENLGDVMPHLNKLFPGVSHLTLTDDKELLRTEVTDVVSKEGEVLSLRKPVVVSQKSHIVSWLRDLEVSIEDSMKAAMPPLIVSVSNAIYCSSSDSVALRSALSLLLQNSPAQLILLALKIVFTENVEATLSVADGGCLPKDSAIQGSVERSLELVTSIDCDEALQDKMSTTRFQTVKEQVIKELVYQRGALESLRANSVEANDGLSFPWYSQLRFYAKTGAKVGKGFAVEVQMADAVVACGWEYLGVGETLVQTPLTCRCFLTLMQALKRGLGGAPFGPAGTGKTESVKALGRLLGKSVAVFNCDEGFDAISVGRILAGVCRTGSWVCFDEFNRLSAGILSSTSNQLAGLQSAIQHGTNSIGNFYGGLEKIRIESGVAVFVTMNPTYSGRRELPANLTSLFRPMAMTRPDSLVIAEVSLLAQGFQSADTLSLNLVECFKGFLEMLPSRPHYDFGLRSLKSAIKAAGQLRHALCDESPDDVVGFERRAVVQSLVETVKPRIAPSDVDLFEKQMLLTFPNADLLTACLPSIIKSALEIEAEACHVSIDGDLLEKISQLYKILAYRPGVILVGPTGSSKTVAWRLLFKAMARAGRKASEGDGDSLPTSGPPSSIATSVHVVDPKLMTSAQLYGTLDSTTREWSDGIFTSALRDLSNASKQHEIADLVVRGSTSCSLYHWLVFDGEVDPDWAENLNSVLDDSRVLTLPTGERIDFPETARILFETESLEYANPSTISRCGMVCFAPRSSLSLVSEQLRSKLMDEGGLFKVGMNATEHLVPVVTSFVEDVKNMGDRVMEVSSLGILHALFALFKGALLRRSSEIEDGSEGSIDPNATFGAGESGSVTTDSSFAVRAFLVASVSALGASLSRADKATLSRKLLAEVSAISDVGPAMYSLPDGCDLCDVYVHSTSGKYVSYAMDLQSQPPSELNPLRVGDPDIVIPTATTLSNSATLAELIRAGCDSMVLLCGPPGCGKSMVIGDALSSMANIELASMSFSSTTASSDILATLGAHASVQRLPSGDLCLRPNMPGSRIVLFCDEVNLGAPDLYGTQTAAYFLRQLLEHGGFWSSPHSSWVHVEGLQVVAACNPPELAGRQSLPARLLRHTHIMRVEAPAGDDLKTIFGTLCSSLLEAVDSGFASRSGAVTDAMIEVYQANVQRFSPTASEPLQPHYVYSPRDLSRWLRGMRHILLEAGSVLNGDGDGGSQVSSKLRGSMFTPRQFGEPSVPANKTISWSDVLSALVHEARRLFIDRLMLDEEHSYAEKALRAALSTHLGYQKASLPDQWYSAWPKRHHRRHGKLSSETQGAYQPIRDISSLRKLVYRKLRAFCEEEGLGGTWMSGSGASEVGCSMIDQFAVTDDVLKHLTRIERVLRLPLGHAVLVGAPGSGKKTLARFAAWMGGLSVHQVRSHAGYTAEHFSDDLRGVLNMAGVLGKPVMMIFDESNALDGEFLEMMNAILACGEVPGLFEGEARLLLLSNLRKQNLGMTGSSTDDALYKTFVSRVRANLHVVFTLSCDAKALSRGRSDKVMSLSKELLTRSPALYNRCVVDWMGDWDGNTLETVADLKLEVLRGAERDAIVKACVEIHRAASDAMETCEGAARFTTPRHFLEFVEQLNRLTLEKADDIQGGASRLKSGLTRLREAGETVDLLKEELRQKTVKLTAKEKEANEALSAMAEEQRLAEKAKVESENLAIQAEDAAAAAAERKADVADQLAAVEPKVRAARIAVSSMRKENLDELRAMPNPPAGPRLALQAVIMLLDAISSGGRASSPLPWQEIRKRMRGTDFTSCVKDFDPDNIPSAVVKRMQKDILRNPEFNIQKIYNSSQAAGPLAEWTMATLEYAEVNDSIAPLRLEADSLEEEQQLCSERKIEAEEAVESFGLRIDECRQIYADLVTESGVVRRDIDAAQGKLKTAEEMIDSLGDEWDRWMAELTVYNETAEYVWGNAVLGAAFISYAGALDVFARQSLISAWTQILQHAHIDVQDGLSMAEYLTTPKERSLWTQKGLPMDETSVQSYAILKRSARYPLIIDPSRRMEAAVRSIVLGSRPQNQARTESSEGEGGGLSAEKAIVVKTSFASTGKNSYLRMIESAMRFGTAVLVEDAEQFDHSIAPVLGQEVTTGDISDGASQDSNTSGANKDTGMSHRLVRLGDRDVDQNPAFRLFLSATDLSGTPAAAVSRCCVVSFTFSEANLVHRCISRALHFIKPSLESKRVELLNAKLTYERRKIVLEENLLSAIAEASDESTDLLEGNLLSTLQALKSESSAIEEQLSLREGVTAEVDSATVKYEPVAKFGVRLFFALQKLVKMNPLYRFSADYFLGIFDSCIEASCKHCEGDDAAAVLSIFSDLAGALFVSVSPSLFPEDQVPFAALVSVIANASKEDVEIFESRLKSFAPLHDIPLNIPNGDRNGSALSETPTMDLASTVVDSAHTSPFHVLPALNELSCRLHVDGSPAVSCRDGWADLVARKAVKNYSTMQGSSDMKRTVFTPLLFCTRGAGVDPSASVAQQARAVGVICESLAVGDSESLDLTRSALEFASEKWGRSSTSRGLLLIKNIHLASPECTELLRREVVKHQGKLPYLLIIAGEVGASCAWSVNPNLITLSTDCRVLAFQAPNDFRSSLTRCISVVSAAETATDRDTARLLTAVSWLHAALVERCRYAPSGISKQYDFSESDLTAARDMVSSLFGAIKANPSIAVLSRLLSETIYGGRLECKADSDVVGSFIVDHFAVVHSHSSDEFVRVVAGSEDLKPVDLPQDPKKCADAIDGFPVNAPASWFGLGVDAESKKEGRAGMRTAEIFVKMFLGASSLPTGRATTGPD